MRINRSGPLLPATDVRLTNPSMVEVVKQLSRTAIAGALALIILALSGGRAQAGPIFSAATGGDVHGFGGTSESGAEPLSVSSESLIGTPGTSGIGKGQASASRGALATFADKDVDAGPIFGTIKSHASFRIDDLVFSLLPKSEFSPFDTFSTSLNYHVGGSMDLGGMNSSGLIEMDLGITAAGVSISQFGRFFAAHSLGDWPVPIETGEWFIDRVGTLSSFATGLTASGGNTGLPTLSAFDQLSLTSPSFNLRFGADGTVGVTTALSLAASAGGGRFRGNPINATTDFGHTLSFPISGPVFNLPDGITVNSTDGLIENNQWTGGPAQPSPVPEPSSLALLGTGVLALVGWGRRRKKQAE